MHWLRVGLKAGRDTVYNLMTKGRLTWCLLGFLTISSLATIGELARAWRAERRVPVTCTLQFEPAPPLRYVEIQLNRQHPIEPSFFGVMFAHVQDSTARQSIELEVRRSGDRGTYPLARWSSLVLPDDLPLVGVVRGCVLSSMTANRCAASR
jgi:hypothetical protein